MTTWTIRDARTPAKAYRRASGRVTLLKNGQEVDHACYFSQRERAAEVEKFRQVVRTWAGYGYPIRLERA